MKKPNTQKGRKRTKRVASHKLRETKQDNDLNPNRFETT